MDELLKFLMEIGLERNIIHYHESSYALLENIYGSFLRMDGYVDLYTIFSEKDIRTTDSLKNGVKWKPIVNLDLIDFIYDNDGSIPPPKTLESGEIYNMDQIIIVVSTNGSVMLGAYSSKYHERSPRN